jgi:hypothetical protein
MARDLARRVLAILILVIAGWFLLKFVIHVAIAIATVIAVVIAIVALIWAIRAL